MKADIKSEWLAALRSGKYKQAKGMLKRSASELSNNSVGFCCMGVLCDISGQGKWKEETGRGTGPLETKMNRYVCKDGSSYGSLPMGIITWAGLNSHTPFVTKDNGSLASLAELNDSDNKSFEEIADLIEKCL